MSENGITIAEATRQFNIALQVENKSPRTVTTYNQAIDRLMQFTGETASLADINTQKLREWILHLQKHKTARGAALSPYTISGYVRCVNAFLSWCVNEGLLKQKPNIKPPKVPYKRPYVLSNKEIQTLLEESKRVSSRVSALVSFLLDTGCRASEVCNMLVEDVNLEECTAIIHEGKGSKDRVVQFGKRTSHAIWKYLLVRKPKSDFLFCTSTGEKLTYNALRLIIARMGRRAGISDLHPHVFRHTFATLFLGAGGSVVFCQKLMGHENINTTMSYVDMAELRTSRQHISVVEEALDG